MRKMMIQVLIIILIGTGISMMAQGAQKTRLLMEEVGPDQSLERHHGLPVIISQKQYRVVLSPETIMPESNAILYFNLIVSNPTQTPLAFSMNHLSAYSPGKELTILDSDEVIADRRRYFSKEEYGITADQEKMLAPFVDEQMERLKEKLMKNQEVSKNSSVAGIIAIQVPFGTENFTIEVVTGNDHHNFNFNVGEF